MAGVLLGVLSGGCGGSGKGGTGTQDRDGFLDKTVIAKVGDHTITARELDDRLRYQFPDLLTSYSAQTERAIREILGVELDHLSLVSEAERVGYADSSARFKQNMEVARVQVLQKDYTEDVIHTAARPSPARIQRFYDENKEQFRRTAKAVVRHILVPSEAAAVRAKQRIEAGEAFADVAAEVTTDQNSARSGGAIGYVEKGQPAPGLGEVPELVDAALDMQEGEMRIVKSRLGWHVVQVDRKISEGYTPLPEVSETISDNLFRARGTVMLDSTLKALRVRFGTRLYDESLAAYMAWRRSGTESAMFDSAQAQKDPEQRVAVYEAYIRKFPHSEHACEARFLIGFTLAEELKDRNRAGPKLREFLQLCPQSELADDAQALLQGLSSAPR